MNAKEYLEQAYRLDELISSEYEEIAKYHALAYRLSSISYDSHISSSIAKEAKFEKIIAEIDEIENKINDELQSLISLKKEIRVRIFQLEDKDERLILYKRYVLFKRWKDILEEMKFTRQWLSFKHNSALLNFSKKFL